MYDNCLFTCLSPSLELLKGEAFVLSVPPMQRVDKKCFLNKQVNAKHDVENSTKIRICF